jgi:hypothetical protein
MCQLFKASLNYLKNNLKTSLRSFLKTTAVWLFLKCRLPTLENFHFSSEIFFFAKIVKIHSQKTFLQMMTGQRNSHFNHSQTFYLSSSLPSRSNSLASHFNFLLPHLNLLLSHCNILLSHCNILLSHLNLSLSLESLTLSLESLTFSLQYFTLSLESLAIS